MIRIECRSLGRFAARTRTVFDKMIRLFKAGAKECQLDKLFQTQINKFGYKSIDCWLKRNHKTRLSAKIFKPEGVAFARQIHRCVSTKRGRVLAAGVMNRFSQLLDIALLRPKFDFKFRNCFQAIMAHSSNPSDLPAAISRPLLLYIKLRRKVMRPSEARCFPDS